VAAVTCLSLGTYVIFKNPHLKSSKLFLLLASIAALACVTDFFLINSPDRGTALFLAHPLICLSTFLAATMFYLMSFLPYERGRTWPVRNKRSFVILVIIVAAVPSVLIETVSEDQYGWWIAMSWPVLWWYVAIGFFYIAGIVAMMRLYRREKRADVRHLIVPPVIAMTMPVIFAIFVILINSTGQNSPPDLSITVLVSSIWFAYAIFRQKLFMLRPVTETAPVMSKAQSKEPRRGILVKDKTGDRAYQLFVAELAAGGQGLLITRKHPEQVRERYGLRETPILWLSTKAGPDSVDPSSVNILTHTALQFLKTGKSTVVFLDGLEHLVAYNRLEDVMHLVYVLKDAAVVTSSQLIVAVDPEAMGDKGIAFLERELEPFMPGAQG
jgi:hypothetical protein